ncbi:hypothetical protein GGR44_000060 [Sphingobium fontiphilum]|uniref:Cyanovirin-N domain-containing protein n=1 Tax=Sphingobium fontiphilum TaxID=944425 RepID=A0A7W6DJX9_9SPHN|nr:CVNH domain-containing protein [Sphingobium fontiphilum]MBB3980429.1 hypothetical protein [Sphingobium fontiphilum]
MKRAILIALGCGAAFWALPASAVPSSFQQTCTDIKLTTTRGSATISANCKKRDGTPIPASLKLKNLTNINGVLTLNPQDPGASFTLTCFTPTLKPESVTLSARCQDSKGVT